MTRQNEVELKTRRDKFISDYSEDFARYEAFARYVCEQIKDTLMARNIEIAYSSFRAKSVESLRKKCEKAKYTNFRSEIMDMAGVRLVTYLLEDVPKVNQVVESLFSVRVEDSGDKLALLGANQIGYLSVHYIVSLKDTMINESNRRFQGLKCEIQVRTVLEDAWAQIFHDRQYKKNSVAVRSEELTRRTNLVSGSLELLDHVISELVSQYDMVSVEAQRLAELLDKDISRDSVIEYARLKFDRHIRFFDYEKMKKLLERFDITTVRNFDELIRNNHLETALRNLSEITTADQFISCVLLVANTEKYIEVTGAQFVMTKATRDVLAEIVDIDRVCSKYGVTIEDDAMIEEEEND